VIQLQRHIEVLLLENECVIVPDFGGFMTHQVTARYDKADRSFLPPTRTLGFNPQLRMNDSVLVQSYVEAYDYSYPEALRQIEKEVEELKQLLSEQGQYEMENLGTLSVNQEGNYEFTPCEAGVLSPELYGLGRYYFKQLNDHAFVEPVVTPVAVEPVAREIELERPTLLDITDTRDRDDNDERTITIKMSWIRNAVAVAAAVVAFFFIATPVANSDLNGPAMSQLPHQVLYKLIPQDTNIVPAEPVMEKTEVAENTEAGQAEKVEEAKSTENTEKSENSEVASDDENITYYIVVASQVKRSNAELYVEKLHRQGYKDAQLYINNDVIRVICGEYQTLAEAYRQLNKMNTKEEFAEAWVYKKR